MKKTMKNLSGEDRKNIKTLRKIYGHKTPGITRRYIGLTREKGKRKAAI